MIGSVPFLRTIGGQWLNGNTVQKIMVYFDHVKAIPGSINEKCRWRVVLDVGDGEMHVWSRFETEIEAQDWLDNYMQRSVNGA